MTPEYRLTLIIETIRAIKRGAHFPKRSWRSYWNRGPTCTTTPGTGKGKAGLICFKPPPLGLSATWSDQRRLLRLQRHPAHSRPLRPLVLRPVSRLVTPTAITNFCPVLSVEKEGAVSQAGNIRPVLLGMNCNLDKFDLVARDWDKSPCARSVQGGVGVCCMAIGAAGHGTRSGPRRARADFSST